MAELPPQPARESPAHHNPGSYIPGETPLTSAGETPHIDLSLPLPEAEALHVRLEELLEGGQEDPLLGRSYRVLGWRILAAKGGTGLTARVAEIARNATSLEEYEAERDEVMGPILEGIERGENRDP